jgi:predicted flavoprotein YhiN
MAAEILSAAGLGVTVYERMPTPGRKLLIAGRGAILSGAAMRGSLWHADRPPVVRENVAMRLHHFFDQTVSPQQP